MRPEYKLADTLRQRTSEFAQDEETDIDDLVHRVEDWLREVDNDTDDFGQETYHSVGREAEETDV